MDNATVQTVRNEKKYSLMITNCIVGDDPEATYFKPRWLSDQHKSGYVNEKMFSLLNAAGKEMDVAKRKQEMYDAFEIAWNEVAPHTNLFQGESVIAYKDTISNFPHTITNYFDFSHVMKK